MKYNIAGEIVSFEDGVGSRVAFSEEDRQNSLKAAMMNQNNDTLMGMQTMMHLNFKPKVVMPSKAKQEFMPLRRTEGGCQTLQIKSANTVLNITSDGVYDLLVYDDFHRLRRVDKGGNEGIESIVIYDWGHSPNVPLGLCLRASLPHVPGVNPEWVTYEYDALGRLTAHDKLSHGGKTRFVHRGNKTTVENARGGWRDLSIDPIGKLRNVKVGDPQEGSVTETDYQYNNRGCLKKAVLPRIEGTQIHTFTCDNAGRRLTSDRAESGLETCTYNTDGTLASRTDAKGQRIVYSYDLQKRITAVKRFDADGQIRHEQCVTNYYDSNPFDSSYSKSSEGQLTAA